MNNIELRIFNDENADCCFWRLSHANDNHILICIDSDDCTPVFYRKNAYGNYIIVLMNANKIKNNDVDK